jgi:hypothetical protein
LSPLFYVTPVSYLSISCQKVIGNQCGRQSVLEETGKGEGMPMAALNSTSSAYARRPRESEGDEA